MPQYGGYSDSLSTATQDNAQSKASIGLQLLSGWLDNSNERKKSGLKKENARL